MHEPFLVPDGRVERITRVGLVSVELAVQATQPEASCPTCLTPSNAVHRWYRRHPADLPSLGHQVFLNRSVRRLFCRNRGCPRQTFAEPLPALLAPRARRTRRRGITESCG